MLMRIFPVTSWDVSWGFGGGFEEEDFVGSREGRERELSRWILGTWFYLAGLWLGYLLCTGRSGIWNGRCEFWLIPCSYSLLL